MKNYILMSICLFFFSCHQEVKKNSVPQQKSSATGKFTNIHIRKESFQDILDAKQLKGAILIYDVQKDTYYSNDFSWAKTGQLPASTYKIPNSIIGLETKVVADENTMFKWNGEERFLKSWEADLTFKQAFQRSCVPCYQEVARKIGVTRMNQFIEKLHYGNIQVDTINLENFWLQGSAKITQFQQIDFLKRFQQEKLPISKRTSTIVKEIMILKDTVNYVLRGKTGWSIVNDSHNGWFVGYLEKGDQIFYFATNVSPISKNFNQQDFQKNRKEVTYKALGKLGILL